MNEKTTEDPCKINSRDGCDHDRNWNVECRLAKQNTNERADEGVEGR